MDPSAGLSQESDEGSRPPERKGSSRQRTEPNNVPRGSPGRPPQDHRRKRANEQRYAAWGDGIERAWCTRALQFLPESCPVASHPGARLDHPRILTVFNAPCFDTGHRNDKYRQVKIPTGVLEYGSIGVLGLNESLHDSTTPLLIRGG